MKIFIVSASLRKDSLNHKLATHLAGLVKAQGGEADLARMNDFDMPLYNFDDQQATGIPAAAQALADRITVAD
ncbi:MAG: NAD(P)H-dependent oxidoreductase, partial [Rhodospirillaceae bacterium]